MPREIIRQRFGKDIKEAVTQSLLPHAIEHAVTDHKLQIVSQPQINDISVNEGEPLRFRATVEVLPEFELKEYKGLKATKRVEPVTGQDIERTIERFRQSLAVFVPIAFISGLNGQFYKQFALTIAISTVISAFNSLTLSPALSAILLKSRHQRDLVPVAMSPWQKAIAGFFNLFNRGFAKASEGYSVTTSRLLGRKSLMFGIYVILLGLSWASFSGLPKGFIPVQDKQYLISDPRQTGGTKFTTVQGNRVWLYLETSAFGGVPDAGPVSLRVFSITQSRTVPMATPDLQPSNGVVHALADGYELGII